MYKIQLLQQQPLRHSIQTPVRPELTHTRTSDHIMPFPGISTETDPIQDPLLSQALYYQDPQPCSLTTNTPRPIASAPAFSPHHTGPSTETLGDRAI